MDDLTGIEIRYCLRDRTGATAGPTGKAAVEVLAARQGGYLGAERSIYLLTGYSHKEPLLQSFSMHSVFAKSVKLRCRQLALALLIRLLKQLPLREATCKKRI